MTQILSDRRTIRMCNSCWDFSDIYDREWRQSTARAFLIDTSLDEEWEMDECYADGGGILGILLSRRDDLQPCGHPRSAVDSSAYLSNDHCSNYCSMCAK